MHFMVCKLLYNIMESTFCEERINSVVFGYMVAIFILTVMHTGNEAQVNTWTLYTRQSCMNKHQYVIVVFQHL